MLSRVFRSFSNRADYLKTLGLTSSADAEAIKKAYYDLAKQCHPDVDSTQAERFKEIKQAYEELAGTSPEPPVEPDMFKQAPRKQAPVEEAPPLSNPYKRTKHADDDERFSVWEQVFWT